MKIEKMKKLFVNLSVFVLLFLGWAAFAGVASSLFPDSSMISQVEAGDNDKDDDKDKDDDDDVINDKRAKCVVNTGICANQANVTVIGMKNHIDVSSGSGAVLLDVTSPRVDLQSQSGDLTGRGLTQIANFKTRIGNVRAKYCVKPQDIVGGGLAVDITAAALTGSDADLQFLPGSTLNALILNDPAKFKNNLGNCPSCAFQITGSVLNGYLFISNYIPEANIPLCKY